MSLHKPDAAIMSPVRVKQVRLGPAEAELLIAFPWQDTDAPEVRGRLMGPRCAHASTIEVAYYLKPGAVQSGTGECSGRIIIPDPSYWDPARPHLYVGPLELWHHSSLRLSVRVSLGLRTCALGLRGLLWNGQVLPLRGRWYTDQMALNHWRSAGNNLVVVPAASVTPELLAATDREGLLVLVHLQQSGALPAALPPPPLYPSLLGWLVAAPLLAEQTILAALVGANRLVGIQLVNGVPAELPRCDFLCGAPELLLASELGLPLLLQGGAASAGTASVIGTLAE